MKKKVWQAESLDTFEKKRSRNPSGRTKGTYTLRGRELSKQQTLRKLEKKLKTLGSGNIIKIIEVPSDMIEECLDRLKEYEPELKGDALVKKAHEEAVAEWIAANTVDFFNELSLLYGLCEEYHIKVSSQDTYDELNEERKAASKSKLPAFTTGFPRGFEYRLKGNELKAGVVPTGASYVNASMAWLEDQIDNPNIFPEADDASFGPDFLATQIPEMFKRMFRIFAIIYSVCWDEVKENEADGHINTCFKHFYFFSTKYELLKSPREKEVFLKTKVKNICDLTALDKEYQKLLDDYLKEHAGKK